jgi:hypothetical protein
MSIFLPLTDVVEAERQALLIKVNFLFMNERERRRIIRALKLAARKSFMLRHTYISSVYRETYQLLERKIN